MTSSCPQWVGQGLKTKSSRGVRVLEISLGSVPVHSTRGVLSR